MSRSDYFRWFCYVILVGTSWLTPNARAGTACVWKVSGPNGKIIYLGGSVHALTKNDYPLPAAYLRACDASSRMAFEVDARALQKSSESLVKDGKYRKGDSLSKHVDPRTYAYLRRLFGLIGVPEETFASWRPWFIVVMLQSAAAHRALPEAGVDEYLLKRAAQRSMPVVGLESVQEHARVFSGLSDRESEILLLTAFIPSDIPQSKDDIIKAWRQGDAEAIVKMMRRESAEFPAFYGRLLDARNRAWLPKIENFLQSAQTYFVVVGAAHFGGPNGLLALLRAKGYQVEQM